MKKLEGVFVALVTPLHDDGTIDYPIMERQLDYVISAGTTGIFVGGTNSESPYFSFEERVEIFKFVKQKCGEKMPLCVACLAQTTDDTLKLIDMMARHEPDFYAAIPPYYFAVDQDVIYSHYEKLAKNVSSLVVYNIPSTTHNPIEWETLVALARNKNIIGTKNSSSDLASFARAIYKTKQFRPDFSWIMGDDAQDAQALFTGACGVVTGLGNVNLTPYVKVCEAAKRGDIAAMNEAQHEILDLFKVMNCTGKGIPSIKAACALLGRGNARTKLESMTLNQSEIDKVAVVLKELNLN